MLAHPLQNGGQEPHITIMLDSTADGIEKDMRCVCCGRIVVKYYGQIKLIIPGISEMNWADLSKKPLTVQCRNERRGLKMPGGGEIDHVKCKTVYHVIG